MRKIVVGVDGSEASTEALRFAVEEARLRGATLKVVHAWDFPYSAVAVAGYLPQADGRLFEELREAAERLLDGALTGVEAETEGISIERAVIEAPAPRALVDAAEDADLLVVGSRGLGGFAGLLLGSVSQQCAHHAPCPVVIVPLRRPQPS